MGGEGEEGVAGLLEWGVSSFQPPRNQDHSHWRPDVLVQPSRRHTRVHNMHIHTHTSPTHAFSPPALTGHIQILYGNLAPEGSVAKITGKEGLLFEGEALVFDNEEDMITMVGAEPNKFRGKVRGRSGEKAEEVGTGCLQVVKWSRGGKRARGAR